MGRSGSPFKKKKYEDLEASLQPLIQAHGKEIVHAYIETCEAHYDKMDVRPHLFQLLSTCSSTLAQLAIPYHEKIQKTIEQIELDMLQKQLELNFQIYRHTFCHLPKALEEVGRIFKECQKIITEKQIDLQQSIDESDLVNALVLLKTLMLSHEITPDSFTDEQSELWEQLIENPRFKEVCQLELKIYLLLRNMQQLSSKQHKKDQEEFCATIKSLYECLRQKKLPISFVIPEIQPHLKNYQSKIKPTKLTQKQRPVAEQNTLHHLKDQKEKCIKSLNHYIQHRDQTLSYFSYFFDYSRGKIRARHYKNLIHSAQSERELYLIEYAIFANNNGIQLKKDMLTTFPFNDQNTAKYWLQDILRKSYLNSELEQLDKVIDSINQKINANDPTATANLFQDELAYLQKINNSQNPNSFFQPKKQIGFWQWLASWFSKANALPMNHSNLSVPNIHHSIIS